MFAILRTVTVQIAERQRFRAPQALILTHIANTLLAVKVALPLPVSQTPPATRTTLPDTRSVIASTTAQTSATNEMPPERIAHRSHVPIIPIIRSKPVSETQRVIPTQAHQSAAAQARAPATKKQAATQVTATTTRLQTV